MAKELKDVRVFLSSADFENIDYAPETLRVEYCVCDGDLMARKAQHVTGVDLENTLSGIWADIITELESVEGI